MGNLNARAAAVARRGPKGSGSKNGLDADQAVRGRPLIPRGAVRVGAPVEGVRGPVTLSAEGVIAGLAVQRVAARPTIHVIRARAAVHEIRPRLAVQEVVTF